MSTSTTRLVSVLSELAALLESDGEHHWRSWMLRAKARIEGSDYGGIGYLLQAYGGMSSFNDLVLGQAIVDGRHTWKRGHVELNERLTALRGKAWELAQAIKRDHEARST
jgi:hypothetical protein